jgi:nitroreductase
VSSISAAIGMALRQLLVQAYVTELLTSPDDFAAFEADFANHLALSREAQDLLFRDARTASAFTDEPVTDEQLAAVYDLMKWAPTAFNSQPLRVVVVQSEEARARLGEHMGGANKIRTASAPLTVILASDPDFHDLFPQTAPTNPALHGMFADKREQRERLADFNATLQAGYFILAVRAAGLAAGPMTGFDAEGVNRAFFADGSNRRAIMVVNIGHPAGNAYRPRQPRLEAEQVIQTL